MNPSAITFVLGLPLLGFLVLALGGSAIEKAAGRKMLGILSVLPIALAFLLGAGITANVSAAGGTSTVVHSADWISILGFRVPFEWTVDPLSMTMVLIITGIGSLIFLYSTGYMAEEREYSRFFTYLNLFVLSMLILVLGNNLPLLFVGWEGVGLCSYLLIGFWYTDLANAKAANKAFVVNRIGDWGLTLGLFLIVSTLVAGGATMGDGRYLSFDVMLPALKGILSDPNHVAVATAIGLLLFVGAMGKSAQFPLYLWLPDAMAGPTPVSALIHAATMVTSGVVLLNRMHVVFEASPVASAVVCGIGAFTALFAALVALAQTDIKKVLAYSTVSQLGFMFIGVGAGGYWTGMFHVTTHAFFKALLFLGAGAVIHSMAHDQDMRNYGALRKFLPITTWTMVIGTCAIAAIGIPGTPFGFAGFFSKEALLGAALANDHAIVSGIAGWVGLITAGITAFYMFRMTSLTFFGKEERWRNAPVPAHTTDEEDHAGGHHGLGPDFTPHEAPVSMTLPLVVLAVLSTIGGWVLFRGDVFEKWLAPVSGPTLLGEVPIEPHGLPFGLSLATISLISAFAGLVVGFVWYRGGLPHDEGWDESRWGGFRRAAFGQFGYDALLTNAAVEGGNELAMGIGSGVERGLIDGVVNGTGWLAYTFGRGLAVLQRGAIRSYAFLMLIGVVALVGSMAWAAMGGAR